MEVILRETIDKLGRAGEVVKVKPGYARNYLLPRKLAYPATAGNLRVIEHEKAALLKREAKQLEGAQSLAVRLEGLQLTFKRRVGDQGSLFGSVTNADIAQELEKLGFDVEKRKVGLEEHIKHLGEFSVPVRLFKDVSPHLKVLVEAETEEAAG